MTDPGGGGRHRESAGRHRARPRRGLLVARVLAGAVASVAGLLALVLPPSTATSPTPAPGIPVPVSVVHGSGSEAAAPTRVRVPDIDVDSSLVRLGVDGARALVPPQEPTRAGWFPGGPAPGDTGPAVVAGHVDSAEGPAVFFRLAELEEGDDVLITRADGSTVRFTVTSVDRYAKDRFPTERVYGATARPELRLITCGGEFDTHAGSYRDNVVVSAVVAA